MTTLKDITTMMDTPEFKKTRKAYLKNVVLVMKVFKVDVMKATSYIDKATEYNMRNTKDMMRIIKTYIAKK